MKILLFGATGTAGGGVLRACITDPVVEEVRVIGRRAPSAVSDPRMTIVLHNDFLDYAGAARAFQDVDACFFCLGISVHQVSGEDEYRTITMRFARAAAGQLRASSPNAVFHYLSGQGTSLRSRFMWARVKAEAEQQLIEYCGAVCWRPGFIDGADSERAPRLYQLLRPIFRVFSFVRTMYVTGEDLGRAMLVATRRGLHGRIIENAEIRAIAASAVTN
jgi:uncharacterized protein YbjT (DUF2867 family)